MASILQVHNFHPTEFEQLVRKIISEELLPIKETFLKANSPPISQKNEQFLSQKEAANLLHVSIPTFRNLVKERKIKRNKVGKRYRYRVSELLK